MPVRVSATSGLLGRAFSRFLQPWRGPGAQLMALNPAYREFKIGRWTYGWPEVYRWRPSQQLSIGAFCSIAAGVKILLGGEHRIDFISTYPFGQFFGIGEKDAHEWSQGDVSIGNDVWIGQDAMILSGTRIGDGAVIGACSLVRGEIPPYAIAVGNPARVVRYRFPAPVIDELLRMRWWEWDDDTIRQRAPQLMSADFAEFTQRYGSG
jgi:chloramphenicol O-acetyltransferase type B